MKGICVVKIQYFFVLIFADGSVIAEEVGAVPPHGVRREAPEGLFDEGPGARTLFPTSHPSRRSLRRQRERILHLTTAGVSNILTGEQFRADSSTSGSCGRLATFTHEASVTASDELYGPKWGPDNKRPRLAPPRPQGPQGLAAAVLPPTAPDVSLIRVPLPMPSSASVGGARFDGGAGVEGSSAPAHAVSGLGALPPSANLGVYSHLLNLTAVIQQVTAPDRSADQEQDRRILQALLEKYSKK